MKNVRLVILAALLVAALFAAVFPALAISPDSRLNQSFEGDKNGDNIPDKWNVRGNVLRVCDHPYTALDACAMVFLPSNRAAALWQRIDELPGSWTDLEEGVLVNFAEGQVAAKQLDDYRVYAGVRLYHPNGTVYTLYNEVSGGSYPFNYSAFGTVCGETCTELILGVADGTRRDPSSFYGFLVRPGDGYFAVDWLRFID